MDTSPLSIPHHTAGTAGDLTPHADASVPALRSCRGCSAALLTPTQPGIHDTSAIGRIGALDSPNPAGGPVTRLAHQHPSGSPTRVQHDIQPGAIDTGVTAIVALRLDADRTGRVEAMNRQKEAPLRQTTEQTGTSGRWLWVGGMDAADLADHNQRPDSHTVQQIRTTPNLGRKEIPAMQTLPATTQLRDAWEDALEDGILCPKEISHLSKLIERVDDGVRYALTVLKGGPDTRRSREMRDEYESLHGPISIERYARKKHRRDATPTDAA